MKKNNGPLNFSHSQAYCENAFPGSDTFAVHMWDCGYKPVLSRQVPGQHSNAAEFHQLLPAFPRVHNDSGLQKRYKWDPSQNCGVQWDLGSQT